MPDNKKATVEDATKIEDVAEEEQLQSDSQMKISSVEDTMKKTNLNKFDNFFIRVWALLCSFIIKISEYICKGIKFIIKRDVPVKYVAAFVVVVLIVLFILIIALPASANGTAKMTLDLYPNGLIAVQKKIGEDAITGEEVYKWGFANNKGVEKIKCIYDGALDFKYGVAFVKVIESQNGSNYVYWKLINTRGQNVGDYEFVQSGSIVPVEQFSDDQKLAKVMSSGQYGYINNKGKPVIEFIYNDAGPFIGKMARVCFGSSYFFINKKGKQVSATFENARDMVDGYAAVQNYSGKWGFINSKGNIAIEPRYDEVSDFYCGYAAVKSGTSYGIIDEKGNKIVPAASFVDLNVLEYFGMVA